MIDLTQPSGPPLTTGQLAAVVGLSSETIRREITLGVLRAFRRPALPTRGKRTEYRIAWGEARRYAIMVGVLTRDRA